MQRMMMAAMTQHGKKERRNSAVTSAPPIGRGIVDAFRDTSIIALRASGRLQSICQRKVIVHVTFIKVGEINTLKECFDADVLLRCKWREPELDDYKGGEEDTDFTRYWNPCIYIDNVIGEPTRTSSITVEHTSEGEAYVIERRRVKGQFMEKMELWEFPFDVQDLSIIIMSDLSIKEIDLVEDPDEIHKIYRQSFIDEQEFYLYKYIESERAELMKDQADPRVKRAALTVRCRAARRPWYFIWNIFTVTLLICCLSFVTFAVDSDKPQNRLQLAFTLVLTGVAFKFVVNQSLPKISYLTYMDRYVLASMIELSIVCFWHGLQTQIDVKKHPYKDYIAGSLIAVCYLIYNLVFVIRICTVPYGRRREMRKKESEYVATVKQQAERKMSIFAKLKSKAAGTRDPPPTAV